jgi:hypothetical protein
VHLYNFLMQEMCLQQKSITSRWKFIQKTYELAESNKILHPLSKWNSHGGL